MAMTLRASFVAARGTALLAFIAASGCAPDLTLKHQGNGASSEGVKFTDAKRFGDRAEQMATGIAVGSDSSVSLAGNFSGSIDFGKGPLISGGNAAFFVARFDQQGKAIFSIGSGEEVPQACHAIAVDTMGNTFLAGDFTGSEPRPMPGGKDGYLVKLDPTGNPRWSHLLENTGEQIATSLAVDAAGNVVVAGFFSGAVGFGGAPLISAGGYDIFVAKLDPDGKILWNKRFGDKADQRAFGVAEDKAGNTFLVGDFAGNLDFGTGELLKSASEMNVIVVKLGPDGSTLWGKRFGDTKPALSSSVAIDQDGGVALGGAFAGSIDFGGGPLASEGDGGLFVAKFDASGKHVWSRGFGKRGAANVRSVAADGRGGMLFTGEFTGSLTVGAMSLVSAGAEDGFVARLDARGKVSWSERFGDAASQRGTGVAAGIDGVIWLVGGFAGSIDLGGNTMTSEGESDVLLAKLTR